MGRLARMPSSGTRQSSVPFADRNSGEFRYARSVLALLLTISIVGCGRANLAPAGTGAREAAHEFGEGLIAEDWPRAYETLDATSRKRRTPQEFARLAATYRRSLRFVPERFQVQSCEEHDEGAIAHIVLTGKLDSKERRFKDGIVLRKDGDAWHVVLSETFGQRTP